VRRDGVCATFPKLNCDRGAGCVCNLRQGLERGEAGFDGKSDLRRICGCSGNRSDRSIAKSLRNLWQDCDLRRGSRRALRAREGEVRKGVTVSQT
jgi:hypothetical protein